MTIEFDGDRYLGSQLKREDGQWEYRILGSDGKLLVWGVSEKRMTSKSLATVLEAWFDAKKEVKTKKTTVKILSAIISVLSLIGLVVVIYFILSLIFG